MSVAVAAQPFDFSAVDEAATEAVVSGEIPGVVVLVGRGDDILLHRAWGFRRLVPEPAAMTRDTIFDIASLTKPVGTTLAVLSLVERGAIKLDAPLGRYLKEFRGAPYAEITIRRILTHTAGFPAYPANSAVAGGFGMFSTSADLARICRMLLQGGTLGGHRFFKPDTVRLMFEPAPGSQGMRTLGWDLNSPFARPMSPFFPMGSIGHTGFTG